MLELRPNCEFCNKDLPPEASDAMICSFECTFCRDCAETTLGGRLPEPGARLGSLGRCRADVWASTTSYWQS